MTFGTSYSFKTWQSMEITEWYITCQSCCCAIWSATLLFEVWEHVCWPWPTRQIFGIFNTTSDLMSLRMLHTYPARTAASRTRYGVDALDPTFNLGHLGHGLCCCSVLHLRQPTIVFNQAPVMGQGGNQMV